MEKKKVVFVGSYIKKHINDNYIKKRIYDKRRT